jgi:hypothetical protein
MLAELKTLSTRSSAPITTLFFNRLFCENMRNLLMFRLHQRAESLPEEDLKALREPSFTIKLGWRRGAEESFDVSSAAASSSCDGSTVALAEIVRRESAD